LHVFDLVGAKALHIAGQVLEILAKEVDVPRDLLEIVAERRVARISASLGAISSPPFTNATSLKLFSVSNMTQSRRARCFE